MLIKKIPAAGLAVILVLLQGCAVHKLPVRIDDVNYQSTKQARLRTVSPLPKDSYIPVDDFKVKPMPKDAGCYSESKGKDAMDISLQRSIDSLNKLTNSGDSISIGMPRKLSYQAFKENVISATGNAIIIEIKHSAPKEGFLGTWTQTCAPPLVSFVPLAGHDYEVELQITDNACTPTLYELDKTGDRIQNTPPSKTVPWCKGEGPKRYEKQ